MSSTHASIVVGVDDSAGGRAALRYAAAEAQERHLPVVLVRAWEPVLLQDAAVVLPMERVEQAEAELLQEAAALVDATAPGVQCTTRLVEERPAQALIEASRGAAALVVGRHAGRSTWLGPILGRVTGHACCPVLTVPPDVQHRLGPVVVGVDGSAVSAEAVDYAFEQAGRWGQPLSAVLAVQPALGAYLPDKDVLAEIEERGRRFLAEALAGHSEQYPDVEVRRVVRLGGPLRVLLDAASDAALAVVGSHGRGALLRVALGSVSSSLLRSAPCPVAVVPHATVGSRGGGHDRHAEPSLPAPFAATL